MRKKDEKKQAAIIEATIQLVNEIGFAASSVAKIAKTANVSPATIYIYHKNKEDLLVSTYIDIKHKMGKAMLADFDNTLPIRDTMKKVWRNTFAYISANKAYFQFGEQFSNSPYSSLIDKAAVEAPFLPLLETMNKGIEQKIIKDVPKDLLTAFIFHPILVLSNKNICAGFEKSSENIDLAFTMAWDAIKL